MILQSDQEPSIIDVKHKAGTHIPTEIVCEESPVGDSNTNSSVERASKTIQGQIRVTKDHTERQTVATIVLDILVLQWLVRHAAWTLTTFHVGSRIRGRPLNQQIAAFGGQFLFKPHKTAGPQQKLAVNWMDGCWLDFNTRTVEHIVSNNAAVVTCRSIRKRNKEERWNRDVLLGVFGNPRSLQDGRVEVNPKPHSASQISSGGEPGGSGQNQERRERQTHLHHEEYRVCVWSDVGLQGLLGDRITSHGGMSSQDYRTDGE